MGIKCSLMGHRFDETTVERDREEDGTEVVITDREIERCSRCGETRVVSENKEVTALESATDTNADPMLATGGDDDSGPAASADDTAAEDAGTTGDAGSVADDTADASGGDGVSGTADGVAADTSDDAVILDDDGDEADAQADARTSQTDVPDAQPGPDEVDEVPEDDAVILDDGDDDPTLDRDPGEWPEETQDTDDTDEVDTDEQSAEAATGDDTTTAGDTATLGGSGGEWPDDDEPRIGTDAGPPTEGADAVGDWPEETTRDTDDDGPSFEPASGPGITVPEGKFKCSDCGYETEVESSSLRAGDFCPECHRGTLHQHEDAGE